MISKFDLLNSVDFYRKSREFSQFPLYYLARHKLLTRHWDQQVCKSQLEPLELQVCHQCSEAIPRYAIKDIKQLKAGMYELLAADWGAANLVNRIGIPGLLDTWFSCAMKILGIQGAGAAIDKAIARLSLRYELETIDPDFPFLYAFDHAWFIKNGGSLADVIERTYELVPLIFFGSYVSHTLYSIRERPTHD